MRGTPATFLALFSALLGATDGTAQSVANYQTSSLVWDPATLVLVQDSGSYGRMVRLPSREILCAYEWGGDVYSRWSADEGQTWSDPVLAASSPVATATTPEILVLQDGSVMLSYSERPIDSSHAYTIRVCFSRDNGRSWTDNQLVYTAGMTFSTACWEPAQIQLWTGEIQLYFSNQAPYKDTSQEVTLMRSFDGGATWGSPERAIYRPGSRDGMAVPAMLSDGALVIAIEDNGFYGTFKPVIVPGPDQGLGWAALQNMPPPAVYVGAPYLKQFPTGETILSVQNSYGRLSPGTDDYSRMMVYIGDPQAKVFLNGSEPFAVPQNASGLWNSIFLKNGVTVTAISSATVNGVFGLWAIDGHLQYPQGPQTGVRAVVNAAGANAGPVAPGEVVSIFGSGLAPGSGQVDPGSVTVSFGGMAGTVIYASDTQINAVVPDGMPGQADTVVSYSGVTTYPYPLGVTTAAPEIFTQQDGTGQAIAANQDGSWNAPGSAAARGSYVSFWATGQGLVDSAQPYPKPQMPVTASIGGVDAPVAFAGLIYPGVLQVNVLVPAGAPVGDAVNVVLSVGPTSSRKAVTVAVQ